MNRKRSPLSFGLALLILSLFVFTLGFAGAAEAYTARSTGSTTIYGVARSQSIGFSYTTLSLSQPAQPAPVQPAPQPQPQPPSLPAPQLPGGSTALNAQELLLFNLVNSERVSRGLRPLVLDARLTGLARLKSQDMINNRYFSHVSPVYGRAGDMIRAAGIPFSLAAENIGVGGNVRTIFSAFMASSGHRNKILGARYTQTGIGIIYQPSRGYLVTQLFVAPR